MVMVVSFLAVQPSKDAQRSYPHNGDHGTHSRNPTISPSELECGTSKSSSPFCLEKREVHTETSFLNSTHQFPQANEQLTSEHVSIQ